MADPTKLTTEELESAVSGAMLRYVGDLGPVVVRFLEIYTRDHGPITAEIAAAWRRDTEAACLPRDRAKFEEELVRRRGGG